MPELPIEAVLPDVQRALRQGPAAVLEAPPGAGKTTRVPLALLEEEWLDGQRILMLEPRRLAARAAARRMSHLLGERVGETVGYRVRMDTRVGPKTQVEVVTEGILTRMVQSDPALEGVGLVIFDEFHERSLHADLGLAFCLQVRRLLREDLRLLVMSATLDTGPVAELLGDAPIISSEGRSYPVETHYLEHRPEDRIEDVTSRTVLRAIDAHQGDMLVFLPGAGEIRRVQERLETASLPSSLDVMPLYGNLPFHEQDRAIEPSLEGRRKVVLATPIAETSLTIEGIRVVVDSGLMRVPRFDPSSGMTRLETVRVSKASADQRRGRAGRLGPGVCYRLWTKHRHQHLAAHNDPEIIQADLAPLALELARWGTPDPAELAWLDPPPEATYRQAQELLHQLGAVEAEGRVTEHGRRMSEVPLHPRLAHMVLHAWERGFGALACEVAALLSERDVFKGRGGLPEADVRLRLEALRDVDEGRRPSALHGTYFVDERACRHVLKVARDLRKRYHITDASGEIEAAGLLLALAYPDRLAQRVGDTPEGRFRLRSGRMASLSHPQLLSEADYLVAAHVDERRREGRIFLAAPLQLEEIETHFTDQIEEVQEIRWDASASRVVARQRHQLGAVVLQEGPLPDPDPQAVLRAFLEGIREEGLGLLPWSKKTKQLRERMVFLHTHDPQSWPDVSEEALLETLDEWLGPHVYGMRRANDLQRLDLKQILLGMLEWEQRGALDELAPTHLTVPSGSRIPIDYSDPEAPVLAVRLQELFGLTETPRIAGGRVPLTLHLLSPAHRPVQVTQDLASFWEEAYFDVKKDMKGRYPKHYWPDDPLSATPTNRAKPKR